MWTAFLVLVAAPPAFSVAEIATPAPVPIAVSITVPTAGPVATFAPARLRAVQQQADPTPLESAPDEVVVYPSRALVLRQVMLPAGDGRYRLGGLPSSVVMDSVRAKVKGAEVVSLEVVTTVESAVPTGRLEELAGQLEQLRLEREAASRSKKLAQVEASQFERLLESAAQPEVIAAEGGLELWQRSRDLAVAGLGDALVRSDSADRLGLELRVQEAELERQLGDLSKGKLRSGFSVDISVLDIDGNEDQLELSYLVRDASWSPRYDLRTTEDMAKCELVYRAEVRQQSGEDWAQARVSLATVEPALGLVGPTPRPMWLNLAVERKRGAIEDSVALAPTAGLRGLGYAAPNASAGDSASLAGRKRSAESTWAQVEAAGVQATFVLARPETILSRPEPTRVLVGRASLDMDLERRCLPAVDTNVWRVGRAENTSPWVILPGPATLFLAGNYLGTSNLERVRVGEDFDLPLGSDPNLTVERVQSEDLAKPPGVFGSKTSEFEAFRVTVSSNAAKPVNVIVQEVFPRTRSSKIGVELERSSQAFLTGERWDREHEESGVRSFALTVPAGGEQNLTWRTVIKYPSKDRIYRN